MDSLLIVTGSFLITSHCHMLCLCSCHIRPNMKYRSQIWARTAHSHHSRLRLRGFAAYELLSTLKPLFPQTKDCKPFANLSLDKHCNDLRSFVPPVLIFTVKTRNTTYTGSNYIHFIRIKKEVPLIELIPKNRYFVDQIPETTLRRSLQN